MLWFKKETNIDCLKDILKDPEIGGGLLSMPGALNNVPDLADITLYLIYNEKEPMGVCALVDLTAYFDDRRTFCVDFGIKKVERGKHTFKIAKQILDDIFIQDPLSLIYAIIHKYNKKSKYFARHLGFTVCGKDQDYFYLKRQNSGRST